ncbi:MAG: lactonase family protein [bacterium]|nr:lactonase family protein [bacterium]
MMDLKSTLSLVLVAALVPACGGGGGSSSSSSSSNANKPRNLTYGQDTAIILQQVDVALVPTVDGNVQDWSISPALPSGLSLNQNTGAIHGAANVPLPLTTFEVKASNGAGRDTTEISIVVSPAPRFGFVANPEDDTISQFTTDANTGALQFNGFFQVGSTVDGPEDVVLHPSGDYAFVPNRGDGNSPSDVSSYAIDTQTGQLTSLGSVAVGIGPHQITIAPNGNNVYVTSFGSDMVQAFTVDLATGLLTPAGPGLPTQTGPVAMAVDPQGRYLYVGNETVRSVSIYSIDPATGGLTAALPAQPLNGSIVSSMAVTPDGRHVLLAMRNFNFAISWAIDQNTGALSVGDSIPTDAMPVSLAVHPLGSYVFVSNEGDDTINTYTLTEDGVFAELATFTAGIDPTHVTFDESGLYAYIVAQGSSDIFTFSVDPNSGVATRETVVRGRQSPAALVIASGPGPIELSGQYVYVANRDADTLTGYSVDPDTGDLMPIGPTMLPPGAEPVYVTAEPRGRFLYAAEHTTGFIRRFAIDSQTGVLTPLATVAVTEPTGISIDPSGFYAFVTLSAGVVRSYSIQQTDGALTQIDEEPTGLNPSAVGVDPTGQFLYVTNAVSNTVRSFSLDAGVMTMTGDAAAPSVPSSVRFSPSGRFLYVALAASNLVVPYAIDPDTGQLTIAANGTVDPGTRPVTMVVHPSGLFGYTAVNDAAGSGHVSILGVNPANGSLSILGEVAMVVNPRDVAIDPSGNYLFVAGDGGSDLARYAIDTATGALTFLGFSAAGDAPYSIAITTFFL